MCDYNIKDPVSQGTLLEPSRSCAEKRQAKELQDGYFSDIDETICDDDDDDDDNDDDDDDDDCDEYGNEKHHRPLKIGTCWLVLVVYLLFLFILIKNFAPDCVECAYMCLLLTIIFLLVRGHRTRLFSVFSTYVGVTVLFMGIMNLCTVYSKLVDYEKVALDLESRSLQPLLVVPNDMTFSSMIPSLPQRLTEYLLRNCDDSVQWTSILGRISETKSLIIQEVIIHCGLVLSFVLLQVLNLLVYLSKRSEKKRVGRLQV